MLLTKFKDAPPIEIGKILATYTVKRPISVGVLTHQVTGSKYLLLTPTDVQPGRILYKDDQNQLFLEDDIGLFYVVMLNMSIRKVYGELNPDQYDCEVRQLQINAAVASCVIYQSLLSDAIPDHVRYGTYAPINVLSLKVFLDLQASVDVLPCSANGRYWKLMREQKRAVL